MLRSRPEATRALAALALTPLLAAPLFIGASAWADDTAPAGDGPSASAPAESPAPSDQPAPPAEPEPQPAPAEEPAAQEPVTEEPVAEEPPAETPPVEEVPAADAPAEQAPATQEPSSEQEPATASADPDAAEAAGVPAEETAEERSASPALAAGSIAPGETREYAFTTTNATSVSVVVVSTPTMHMRLVSPQGQVYANTSSDIRKTLWLAPTGSTGTWTLRLTNAGSEPALASYETGWEAADVDLNFSVGVGKPDAYLHVYPLVNGERRTDLAPRGRITSPIGEMRELPLTPQVTGSTAYHASFKDLEPGIYTARVWVVIDGVEYSSVTSVRVAYLEEQPPTVTYSVTPDGPNAHGWFRHDVTARLVSTDEGAGPWELAYRVDGGAWQERYQEQLSIPIAGDGTHTLEYWAEDAQGNRGETVTQTIRIDKAAPALDISAPADGATYEVGEAVTVDFDCDDALSGIDDCVGNVGDGEPLDTSAPGDFSLTFSAVDRAGNLTTRTVEYRVEGDAAAPQIRAERLDPVPASGWYREPTDVLLSAWDDWAGIASIDWIIDGPAGETTGSETEEALATVTFDESGVHELTYWATDGAGKQSEPQTLEVRIDREGPEITISSPIGDVAPAAAALEPGQYEQGAEVLAEFECADPLSGVVDCTADIPNGLPLPTTEPGEHEFTVTATDAAGNETSKTVVYEVVEEELPPSTPTPTPAAPQAGQGTGRGLASTGADVLPAVLIASLLLGAGALAVTARRVARR